jgi:hypothetical protein
MTSRLSPALRLAVAVLAAGLLGACSKDTGPTVNDLGPRARVRVINAIPDTIAMDYKFVDSVIVIEDSLPTLGFLAGGVAIRGVHAAPTVGAVNVFTTRTVAAALPATPAFANLAYGRTTGYIRLATPDSVAARISVVATPATVLSAQAQPGLAGTSQLNPIGGSRIAGTSMSAVAFPAGLGARATGTATTPSVVWFVDGDPPETVPRLRP